MNSDKQRPIRIGICGLGTVGGGTYRLLSENREEIARRLGRELEVCHLASRTPKVQFRDAGIPFSSDIFAVVDDPQVDIVVETIGGFDPARELLRRAVANGKHVVTANKALIALHGNELFELAKQNGVTIAYESAVAGGIPIIKALREGLAANAIQWLAGIINGTGNFILTAMDQKQRAFADVLKEAQALGYAEADPTFDVEGIDAAHKLTILASIAFGIPLQFDSTYTEGISAITIDDVKYARELGYVIKHLGIARRSERGVEMRVHPTLISEKRLLAHVNGVMNAVLVKGNSVGATLYYGAGAGAEATASSVVADIMDIARNSFHEAGEKTNTGLPSLAFNQLNVDLPILPIDEIDTAYYLRIEAEDKVGVMAKITGVLQNFEINIEAVIQKEPESHATGKVPVVILTDTVREKQMNQAIQALEALQEVPGRIARIRVEELDSEESQ
ncbi:MAG: homoserine dehydrogenase [Gammaproteobacteria bacterium]|nr:homoserine dehydrogenase [Pseudomonadales bacterium]